MVERKQTDMAAWSEHWWTHNHDLTNVRHENEVSFEVIRVWACWLRRPPQVQIKSDEASIPSSPHFCFFFSPVNNGIILKCALPPLFHPSLIRTYPILRSQLVFLCQCRRWLVANACRKGCQAVDWPSDQIVVYVHLASGYHLLKNTGSLLSPTRGIMTWSNNRLSRSSVCTSLSSFEVF